jgi:hypothetical protein
MKLYFSVGVNSVKFRIIYGYVYFGFFVLDEINFNFSFLHVL